VFASAKKQVFFLYQIKLNWVIVELCSGFKGLDQESWKNLHPDGLYQESIWRIPRVHQNSMMVHNGCYLKRGPDGLQEDS
jgi:hypothetical protein